MKKFFERLFKTAPSEIEARKKAETERQEAELMQWDKESRPAPPPHIIKQQTLREYADTFGLNTLVETGTYYGEMVEAMKGAFGRIYSIELSGALYEKATSRFAGNDDIRIIQGDSGVELERLVGTLEGPTLFWLDGHYSAGVTAKGKKDTPVYEELGHIFNARLKRYVIVIDDARLFGNDPAYPTIEELSAFILAAIPGAGIEVKDDSIRIIPEVMNG